MAGPGKAAAHTAGVQADSTHSTSGTQPLPAPEAPQHRLVLPSPLSKDSNPINSFPPKKVFC